MTDNNPVSTTGIEEILTELNEKGVRAGEENAKVIIANAEKKAQEIVAQAEGSATRILENANNEAERRLVAARAEQKRLLELFMASLPDMFSKKAQELIDRILQDVFDKDDNEPSNVMNFVDTFTVGKSLEVMHGFEEVADVRSFVEGLLIMAVAFYADADGLTTFTIDETLRHSLAKKLSRLECGENIHFEFAPGIDGFCFNNRSGAQVTVSPHSFKAMAEEWASDEFRQIFLDMKIKKLKG